MEAILDIKLPFQLTRDQEEIHLKPELRKQNKINVLLIYSLLSVMVYYTVLDNQYKGLDHSFDR